MGVFKFLNAIKYNPQTFIAYAKVRVKTVTYIVMNILISEKKIELNHLCD